MFIKLSRSSSLWVRRLALYFSLYIIVIIFFHFLFLYFNYLHTEIDSARYMISALVQSEAAIMALVITLSLVAVQLAASSYSARVIDIFKKSPDLWILILVYGIVMFYGLVVLKLLEKDENGLSNLEFHISFVYYLGIFAFTALIPYFLNTLELLKPSTVIHFLAESSTDPNFIEGKDKSDPFQSIIDIIRGSMMIYDYETVRDGLREIVDHLKIIIEIKTLEDEKKEEIFNNISSHFTRLGKMSASRNDEDATLEVIDNLLKTGKLAIEQNLDQGGKRIGISLGVVGKVAAQQELKSATRQAIKSIEEIGIVSAEYKLKQTTWQAAKSLKSVGITATEQELRSAAWQAAKSLRKVGLGAFEQNYDDITLIITGSIGDIGVAMAIQHKAELSLEIKQFIKEILKIAEEKEFETTKLKAEEYLEKIDKIISRVEK